MMNGSRRLLFCAPQRNHIGSADPHAVRIPARRAEYLLAESALSPFQAEPTHSDQRATMPATESNTATVILRGHWLNTGISPLRSLRTVRQCETPESTVATMPRIISVYPNSIAAWCNRMASGVGDCARTERKKPTRPNPKLAMVSVVLIHASVVRSRASPVRNPAMVVRFSASAAGASVG